MSRQYRRRQPGILCSHISIRLLSAVFDRLFRYYLIPRAPLNCACGAALKQRQTVDGTGKGQGLYTFEINVDQPKELQDAISDVLWDRFDQRRDTVACPSCAAQNQAPDTFFKFAYCTSPSLGFFFPLL